MQNKRVDDFVDLFAKQAASQLFALFDKHQKDKGYEFVVKLSNSFLQRYIFVIVLNTLSALPSEPSDDKQVEEHIYKNYYKLKALMQDSIANGFQNAISTFERRNIEFYCHLVPVTEPANKKPC